MHTPLPWTLHLADAKASDGTALYNIHPANNLGYIREDDARLIVRAVNSHQELVEACKWAEIQSHHPDCPISTFQSSRCECFVGKATAALAKATGEQQS